MATLSLNDIKKRNNAEVFVNAINNKELFKVDEDILKATGNVKINNKTIFENDFDLETFQIMLDTNIIKKLEVELSSKQTKYYSIRKLFKDKRFGGSGAGSSTAKEDAELASLQTQIKDAILLSGDYIIVNCNGKKHKISGAESTPGTPKSDFHLLDENGKECVWISHKDGNSPKSFQQWGGVSKKEYPNTPKEVNKFVEDIKEMFGNELPRATTIAREINDKELCGKAIYGIDFGKKLGRQNVSVLLQGKVKLVKSGPEYILDAFNVHYNGYVFKDGYKPVLMAIYKGDRSNFGIKGARFGIVPKESRKVTHWI